MKRLNHSLHSSNGQVFVISSDRPNHAWEGTVEEACVALRTHAALLSLAASVESIIDMSGHANAHSLIALRERVEALLAEMEG